MEMEWRVFYGESGGWLKVFVMHSSVFRLVA